MAAGIKLPVQLRTVRTVKSADWCLGEPYNMVQCYFLLAVMAQITGLKPGKVYHKMVNVHMYEDQVELFKSQQLDPRRGYPTGPSFHIDPSIQSLEDLRTRSDIMDLFHVEDYYHSDRINYPFSV